MGQGERLGLFGGTFDPVHLGHLFAAEECAEVFRLDRVLLIPCGAAPHKDAEDVADAEHRHRMCEIAVAGNPRLAVSRAELDRPGPSYAFDTVQHFLEDHLPDDLHVILGTDAFVLINTWYRYRELLDLCTFIVIRRPGEPAFDASPMEARPSRLHHLDVKGLEVSSSDIRNRARDGRGVKYLVLPAVEEYIQDHGLYRT